MRVRSAKRGPTGRRPTRPARPLGARLATLALLAAVLAFGSTAALASDGGAGPEHHKHHKHRRAGPYRGDGMWIWYVSKSAGGDPARIARRAKRHGIETVYVKSSDGSNAWSQFTSSLVSKLHNRGLRVCAWQFVYGVHPIAEARRGAEAVKKGANCLVIDAEGQYEGRYASADSYVDHLRGMIGSDFPTALAGFPYVDFHPSFPYSVFLGPGGAHFNLPQMYWHSIGVSVGEAYRHTWRFNRVYERHIYPLGQTYANPPVKQIQKFRRWSISFHFNGVSWWDWQETTPKEWRALGRPISRGAAGVSRPHVFPFLAKGSHGDLVVWAQEHLKGAGEGNPVTGNYGKVTVSAVRSFQKSEGLAVDGKIGPQTWRRLLRVKPVSVDWSSKGKKRSSAKRSVAGADTPAGAAPASAGIPAVRDEIPPAAQRH